MAFQKRFLKGAICTAVFVALLTALLSAGQIVPVAWADSTRFDVPAGSHPHDVAPAPDGGPVYFTAQRSGHLGILDPATGRVDLVSLGPGSAPHGVIVGPDAAAWVTDGGLNAIVRVDPSTRQVRRWPLPADASDANLNTATFDRRGRLWFTGQAGYYGRLDPGTGDMRVWRAPRLVGLARPHLGQFLEHRASGRLRSFVIELARMETARDRTCVRRVGRFLGSGVA